MTAHGGGSHGGGANSEGVVVASREVVEKSPENLAKKLPNKGCRLIGREGLSSFFRPLLIRLGQAMS